MSELGIPTDSAGTPLPASLEGYFLISETELVDPNFQRTVVLLINHNEEGAFGLVVNRPADLSLADVVEEFQNSPIGSIPTYFGGPVEQQYLFALHSGLPASATSEFAMTPTDGVTFEPVFQAMESYFRDEWPRIAEDKRPHLTFYLGYAGWGPGQLEGELREKAWLVIPADPEIVFHPDPAEGWSAALAKKGGLYSIVAQTGSKPSLN
jgi:putative transcriptional regulator